LADQAKANVKPSEEGSIEHLAVVDIDECKREQLPSTDAQL